MEASPVRVIQYFDGEKQNLIPLFQRPYTWTATNWETLWNDIMVQYETGDTGSHFMGAIVSVPARSVPVGVSKYLIIDGQQRLTTISLLLCALRDCLDSNSASRIQEVYLTNRFRETEDTLKFVPTQADRDVYNSIALYIRPIINNNDSLMSSAYSYFKIKLSKGVDLNEESVNPSKVLTILEKCLQVVMINLSDDDDPYLIFESLNFKGEPLTQADLVRNYLLMRFRHSTSTGGEQERIYSKYWTPLENTLKGNLTEFLRHYMMKDGDDIKKGGIYAAIRARLKNIESMDIVELEAKSMQSFGIYYSKFLFPEKEEVKIIQNSLENIKDIKVTTSFPLLLRLFDVRESKKLSDFELEKCLSLIESFVIRRFICNIATNPLNKLFIQLSKNFPSSDYYQWLHRSLSDFIGIFRFPRDIELTTAFMQQPQYERGNTRFILCRLEKAFEHKESVDLSNATVEHILPQTLTSEWRNELGESSEEIYSNLVHTFGNLTLTSYNPELSNLPFLKKKEKLQNTHIELNRWILQQNSWTNIEIENRARMLLNMAIKIWISPLDMISG